MLDPSVEYQPLAPPMDYLCTHTWQREKKNLFVCMTLDVNQDRRRARSLAPHLDCLFDEKLRSDANAWAVRCCERVCQCVRERVCGRICLNQT